MDEDFDSFLRLVRETFSYDPETGLLSWARAPNSKGKIGGEAGTLNKVLGYRYISMGRKHRYATHRIAFLLFHGRWPVGQIDHINGDRSDNRLVNLREVSQQTNLENHTKARSSSKSGLLGVSPAKNGRWRATIGSRQKQTWLGTFDTKEEAHQAYLQAKRRIHAGCTI